MVKLSEKFLKGFVSKEEIETMQPFAEAAHSMLMTHTGPGNDFHGWVNLPCEYDKDEFERIKAAANKINGNSDILIVIGIGGSYLGARAAIEFVKSPLYNDLANGSPKIYFAGNNISTTALTELISICEGNNRACNSL